MDLKRELEKFTEGLEQLRDEVKVQLHLAGLESKQEWENAEKQREHFLAKLEQIARESKGNTDDLIGKATIVGEELKATYQRLKDRLSE